MCLFLLHCDEVLSSTIIDQLRAIKGRARSCSLAIRSSSRLGWITLIPIDKLRTLWLPKEEKARRITRNKSASITWHLQRSYTNSRHIHLKELHCFLELKVPYLNLSALIAKKNLNFIRVHHCAQDHDSSVVALPLISTRSFEVKDLNRAILTSHKKPFILPLKFHRNRISRQSIKCHFLALF